MSLEISTSYGWRHSRRALATTPVFASDMVRASKSDVADAKLIEACRQLVTLRDRGSRAQEILETGEDEQQSQFQTSELTEDTERLLAQIEALGGPKTLEGVRAVSAAAISLAPVSGGEPLVRDNFEWLMLCVVEFFTRGAGSVP